MAISTTSDPEELIPEVELPAAIEAAPTPERSVPLTLDVLPSQVVEALPWIGIGLVALTIRLVVLAHEPLSPSEAMYAFSAWQATRGQLDSSLVELGAPLLTDLLAGLFFLFDGSDGVARVPSVLAGVGLVLACAIFAPLVGRRTALAAGLLVALSPIAVHLARVADPASLSALLAALLVGGVARLVTDRPSWSPWLVSIVSGFALASSSGTIVALLAAVIAALSAWQVSRAQLRQWAASLISSTGRTALLTAGLTALIASTAGFADLRGIGFVLGDIWAGLVTGLAPSPFPSRNFAALLAYHGPVLLVALLGAIWGMRTRDKMAMFLAQWSLLLIAVAIGLGQSVLTLSLLPVVPTALLAGLVLARVSWSAASYAIGGSATAVVALTAALGGVAILVIAQGIGSDRGAPMVAIGVVIIAAVLVAYLWWREMPRDERMPALVILGVIVFGVITVGSIGRLAYGGSEAGSEILLRQQTSPQLRHTFEEIRILAMADVSRVLVLPPEPAPEIRWYARIVPQTAPDRNRLERPIVVREAPPLEATSGPALGGRVPWTTISTLNRNDLHPLAILRWVVSRVGVVQGTSRDLIVTY